jgi:hypothetical protein
MKGDTAMLHTIKELERYAIHATDGVIGHVRGVYFDDESWVMRYLVVDTGGWFANRKVLVSPMSVVHVDRLERTLSVSITRQQVKDSPDIDTDKPISRQHESGYLGYYGYPDYWGGGGFWGEGSFPSLLLNVNEHGTAGSDGRSRSERVQSMREARSDPGDDVHLRSCEAVTGYRIEASDGHLGHVKGFVTEEETWAIRYLIVTTGDWWMGHEVLIAVRWIDKVSWPDSSVSVSLTRQAVKESPVYDSARMLDRVHEESVFKHYEKTGYWTD